MYRPNRIGPSPLVTLETVAAGRSEIFTKPFGAFLASEAIGGLPNEHTHARSVHFTQPISIEPLEQGSIGVSILGTVLNENDIDRQYLLSVSGSVVGFTSGEGLTIRPIIGRVLESGVALSDLEFWSFPPSTDGEHVRTSGAEIAPITSSCNITTVLGDWAPQGGDAETNDLYFGWWFANSTGVAIEIANCFLSVSIHRYIHDLNPFDPNR